MSPESKFDRFKIEWLLIKDLLPHPKVQRPYNTKWAAEIGASFDPDKFRPLDVLPAPRNDKFYVFAGQHRLGGARLALGENQRVPCHVHDADTPLKQLASVCLGVDSMLSWKPIDSWKLRIIAQEEIPVKIDALLTRHGLVAKGTIGKGVVRAVAALEGEWLRHGGEAGVDRVLTILGRAWGDDKDCYDGLLIRGLGLMLYRVGSKVADDQLVDRLQRNVGPARLIGMARDYSKASGTNLARAMAEKLLMAYNLARRQDGRLSLDEPIVKPAPVAAKGAA